MTGHDVVTMGEAMALFIADPGVPLASAHRFSRQVAGAESNLAVGLARLGCSVAWVGRVGEDALGQAVLRTLRGEGVDVSGAVVDPDRPTGMLVRDAHADRPVEVVYGRASSAGARLCAADLDLAMVAGARLLHVTGITPVLSEDAAGAVTAAVRAAVESSVPVSFDPNVRRSLCSLERAVELLRPLAADARLVLTGDDEARVLSGRDTPQDAAAWFLEQGAELVVVKAGAEGSWATDGVRTWSGAVRPVRVVDPVGAGDAFDAGFLAAWLAGSDVPTCLAEAAAVAGQVVATLGDLDGLPTRVQLRALLDGADDVRR